MTPTSSHLHDDNTPCFCAPHPALVARVLAEPRQSQYALTIPASLIDGLNDGMVFPPGDPRSAISNSLPVNQALDRAPLRGKVNCVVVLVEFEDQRMGEGAADRFRDLFFSTHKIWNGSVHEYFSNVSSGKISITGGVIGPYLMPNGMHHYANGECGASSSTPNVQSLAADALSACRNDVDFDLYDNDGNGQVDAFVVVHAGRGAETTGNRNDIWSVKWVLPKSTLVNNVNVYAFLTVPEDAQMGVCSHELGHALFGWPDLYDIDGSSEGVGDWCLMGSGSWGGSPVGSKPCHPSAWCKVNQGWVELDAIEFNGRIKLEDVKTGNKVLRLWSHGNTASKEYFLVENRQQAGFDTSLPGGGLLIWHIDDEKTNNSDPAHYKVALMQADGLYQLEKGMGNTNSAPLPTTLGKKKRTSTQKQLDQASQFNPGNRGDSGDPWKGGSGKLSRNVSFHRRSVPSSDSYTGQRSFVEVNHIHAAAATMKIYVAVRNTPRYADSAGEGSYGGSFGVINSGNPGAFASSASCGTSACA
ncbi:M6 metalloprotease [Mytilinidion resinicola]|uniref:M6 metalloprotease n=1 Tax=Mytilinidion resinicola TaxID=574789 RepID=A0A6A6XZ38_9PEZI|nr:M6 metalloprotease [Mytilinidion resinicola]KAF2801772.1 M6 metalloprotease [Mytilinidion resinicola]